MTAPIGDDKWYCDDCVIGQHLCFICNQRGVDYQVRARPVCRTFYPLTPVPHHLYCGRERCKCAAFLVCSLYTTLQDVHKCVYGHCGKYYHEACLESAAAAGQVLPTAVSLLIYCPREHGAPI